MQFTKLSDEQLMQEFIKGNKKAFDELYTRYYGKLLYFIKTSLRIDNDEAKDVLHDVFMKIMDNKSKYNTSKKFSSWAYTIANNQCINISKHKIVEHKANKELSLNTYDNKDSKNIGKGSKTVRKALEQLSAKHKKTFLLRFTFGLSIKEVAEILEVSEGTVKSRLFYCIQKLNTNEEIKELKYAR